jgi:hypothetical protein
MKDVRYNTLVWMASAFCASLALAISVLSVFGLGAGLHIALVATARLAFLIYLPAYVGGPLVSLFGDAFLPIRKHARDFGLAFAAAILVHLGLVTCLCAVGSSPPAKTFAVFGLAAVFTYLLALLSVRRVRQLLPEKFWPLIRAVATNYIALAFIKDFANSPLGDFRHEILYLPFLTLAIGSLVLNLAAWVQSLNHTTRKMRLHRQSL